MENTTGDVVTGRAKPTGVPVFYKPKEDAEFDALYPILPGSVFRLIVQNEDKSWGLIHPDNGVYNPWSYSDKVNNVYVKLSDMDALTYFPPTIIYPDTGNEDKIFAVTINGGYANGILLEKDRIVAKVPVGLNRNITPVGEHRIDLVRTTRNMHGYERELQGVPFPQFYGQGGGYAVHGAPWRDWDQIDEGYTGSHGCINLANWTPGGRYNIQWGDQNLGFDHFFFNWTRTNTFFDIQKQEEYSVEWTDPGWWRGNTSLRVLVCNSINGLWNYATHPYREGSFSDWNKVIEQYNGLDAYWRFPHMENNTVSFRDVKKR